MNKQISITVTESSPSGDRLIRDGGCKTVEKKFDGLKYLFL